MTAILILLVLVALGPLALRYGVDSRDNDARGRQPHWPAG
jgi:hypothetical protein